MNKKEKTKRIFKVVFFVTVAFIFTVDIFPTEVVENEVTECGMPSVEPVLKGAKKIVPKVIKKATKGGFLKSCGKLEPILMDSRKFVEQLNIKKLEDGFKIGRKKVHNQADLFETLSNQLEKKCSSRLNEIRVKCEGFDEQNTYVMLNDLSTYMKVNKIILKTYDFTMATIERDNNYNYVISIPSKIDHIFNGERYERMKESYMHIIVNKDGNINGVMNALSDMFYDGGNWQEDKFLSKLRQYGVSSSDIMEEYSSFVFAELTLQYEEEPIA